MRYEGIMPRKEDAVRGDHAAWEGRWDYWTMLPEGMLLHEGMLRHKVMDTASANNATRRDDA